jgi:LemA protein
MEMGLMLLLPPALAVAVVIWAIITYNGFIRLRNTVEEAFATMDVYMKKRYDLIPNLVETVKGYVSHERETLEKVVQARSFAAAAGTAEGRMQGENMLQGALRGLFAVAEAYPELKANQNFFDLQQQLRQAEEDIANARKYYNAVVKEFNTKTESFPGSLVAMMCRFVRKPRFEVGEATQRETVNVRFN